MNRPFGREVLECAMGQSGSDPLALFDDHGASESGRGMPQSKPLARGSLPMRDLEIVEALP